MSGGMITRSWPRTWMPRLARSLVSRLRSRSKRVLTVGTFPDEPNAELPLSDVANNDAPQAGIRQHHLGEVFRGNTEHVENRSLVHALTSPRSVQRSMFPALWQG